MAGPIPALRPKRSAKLPVRLPDPQFSTEPSCLARLCTYPDPIPHLAIAVPSIRIREPLPPPGAHHAAANALLLRSAGTGTQPRGSG
jgi:hypothetical protein